MDNEQDPAIPTPATGSVPQHTHSHHREFIADRTGQLIEHVADVIQGQHRSAIMLAEEPATGVQAPVVIKPGGAIEVLSKSVFDQYRDAPERITDRAVATRLSSFTGLVNRFRLPQSAIFAVESPTTPSLTAIIDYHTDTNGPDPVPADPAFGHHRIKYPFPLSPEWKTWMAHNDKKMDMVEFAEFIEENIVNVETVPVDQLSAEAQSFIAKARGKLATPTDLFELSRGLTVHENSKIVQATNLATGEGQVVMQSEHVDEKGQTLSIPNMFVIVIPVWDKSPDYYRIVARLRYRKQGGLVFWYELWRADLVFQTAFDEVIAQVEAETTLPVYVGSANSAS